MKQQVETYTLKLTDEQCKNMIPQGSYCYTRDAVGKMQLCPFWNRNPTKPTQENGYCAYLKCGDWEGPGFGLLWDQCKECGVNEYRSDYDE